MESPSPRELRKYIFDRFLNTARAPSIEEVMGRYSIDRGRADALLQQLEAGHHLLLLPGTQRILMANPFSNLPTAFRVSVGPQRYFANCAWDAIAFHPMLGRPIGVSSFCHHCGAPVEFRLEDGKASGAGVEEVRVYLGTPVARWYDDLVVTCSNTMVFFLTPTHFSDWQAQHIGSGGELLSIARMLDVVTPISRHRAELDYQMPSRAELMAAWDSVGMGGAFWTC
jgi:hypothetical protein